MGIQDDIKDTHRRDTVPTNVRGRGGHPSQSWAHELQVHNHDENKNDEAMRLQLDLIDEIRMATKQRLARYQDRMAKHYNSRV